MSIRGCSTCKHGPNISMCSVKFCLDCSEWEQDLVCNRSSLIKEFRVKAKISRDGMCEKLQISMSTLSKFENVKSPAPTWIKNLWKIDKAIVISLLEDNSEDKQ